MSFDMEDLSVLHHPTPAFGPPTTPIDLTGLSAPTPPYGCRPGEPDHIDGEAYVRDMRAAGADLYPIRGPNYGGMECDGRFGLVLSDAGCRGAVDDVEARYASIMQADPVAVGRVSEALFREQTLARAAASIGGDLSVAYAEVTRLRAAAYDAGGEEELAQKRFEHRLKQEGLEDSDRPSAQVRAIEIYTGLFAASEAATTAGEEAIGTEEYALTLPIHSERDALFKLLIAIGTDTSPSPDIKLAAEEAEAFLAACVTAVAS